MHTFSDGSQITRAEKDERDRRERLGSVDFQQKEMMRAAQGQLNALSRHYSNLRKEQGVVNDQRSRGTQAVNTLTGLAGSTEANQTVAKTDKENQQAMKLLADEQSLAVQEVLGMVRTAAVEEARAQRESFRLDMAAEDERRAAAKTEAVNNAKILAGAGVTADGYAQSDPEGFAFLSQQVGGEEVLRAMFTLNRPQETILDKRVEGGKYVIAYQNPIDGKVRIESVDLGLPPSYTKTLDAGDRILAIPDNWSGDPSELITINKGMTPSQAASGGGGSPSIPGTELNISAEAQAYVDLINKGTLTLEAALTRIGSSKEGKRTKAEIVQALSASGGGTTINNRVVQEAKALVDDMISRNDPRQWGYSARLGGQFTTGFGDAVNRAERLNAMLAKDNLGIMTGVLTDQDIQLIKDLSGGINTAKTLSESYVRSQLQNIQTKLANRIEELGMNETAAATEQGAETDEAETYTVDGVTYVRGADGLYYPQQ
jgi:hypothetical protein